MTPQEATKALLEAFPGSLEQEEEQEQELYCTYCHTFGHDNTDCPEEPVETP